MPYPDPPPTETQPALSFSALRSYTACRRKWYFQSLTQEMQHPRKWDIIKQKKLLGAHTLTGVAVDGAIDEAIRTYKEIRQWPNDLLKIAKRIAKEHEEFSHEWTWAIDNNRKWPQRAHVRPLDTVFYEGSLTKAFKTEVVENAEACLKNFVQFMQDEELYDADPQYWRVPDRDVGVSPWFTCDDIPIYAKYDFAITEPDKVTIIDWKAGKKEGGEYSARQQLLTYGIFAAVDWCYTLPDITLRAVWLKENAVTKVPLEETEAFAIRGFWRKIYDEMGVLAERNRQNPAAYAELFPMVDDLRECRWCQFRSCEGRARLASLAHESVVEIEETPPEVE